MDNKKGLTANALKYIAIAAMLIDHIAWCFVDISSLAGQLMHTIGRLTAPIMCYFIAEGYHYTRNVRKYMGRLGIFAIISWLPFVYMESGELPIVFDDGNFYVNPMQSMIFTLFLGLLTLVTVHNEKLPKPVRTGLAVLFTLLSFIGDWAVFGVVWIFLFDRYRGDFKKQAAAFIISGVLLDLIFMMPIDEFFMANLFQFGIVLAVIPLYFYNGKKGSGAAFHKWIFYIFYPLHILVLGLIRFGL